MKKLPIRLSCLCLIISLCVIDTIAQEQLHTLSLNSPIERELAGAQTHTYTLSLKPGQIAQVVAEKHGIDLVVAVISPDGKRLFEVSSQTWTQGGEKATIFAQKQGAYRIEIRALDLKSPAGKYVIRLERFLTESEYMTERLAGLGRLWGAVKFFHPFLAYKDINWDGALIKAIPRVKAAHSPEEYRTAIGDLLEVLNDPSTTVETPSTENNGALLPSNDNNEPTYFRVVDGFVVVSATDWASVFVSRNYAAFMKQPQMIQEVAKAKGVLLDCRYKGMSERELPSFYLTRYLDNAVPELVQGTIPLGTSRYRMHDGYAPQRGTTSSYYTSSLVTESPGAIIGSAQSKKPLAVIIDEKTPDLIMLLSGLQAAGAKIVQIGKTNSSSGVQFHPVVLPDGVRVRMRTTEFLHPNGASAFEADVQIPDESASEKRVVSAAITALEASAGGRVAAVNSPPATALRSLKDEPYAQMSFPSEEYRLLALFRFWNVINYFSPYKHLTDKPWATVLSDFIPRFLDNKSVLDYEMTVAEMAARLQDTHGFVVGDNVLKEHLGMFAPPIILRSVAGKLAVAGWVDETAAKAAGLKVGDVILTVDGESTEQRITYLTKFTALSTPQATFAYVWPLALRGAKDSKVRLGIEGATGPAREIELTRSASVDDLFSALSKTPVYQVLPSGYGYMDLTRLPLVDAHKAMDAVMDTPAIIFDMRGYPNGTAWEIAPRLTEKKNVTGALFSRPIQVATSFGEEGFQGGTQSYSFEQKLPESKGAIYKGKVVMLINEDAISQAEHTCLFFESATHVTFIGSPTNGANGDITNLVLPGGVYISFSGHNVRHADGRQLQRVGIQPQIKVEATIKGVREGRDEVLEAAVKFLDSNAKR
jgi:C-terminal processing protease CtpA/Prc